MQLPEGVSVPDSPYAVQLERGFRYLRFTPMLESEFRPDYTERNLPRMRAGFLVAVGLYLIFLLIRALTETGPAAIFGFVFRSLIIVTMLATVAVSYYAPLRRYLPACVFVSYMIFAMGVTAIEVVAQRFGIDRHYEGLIFITIHAYVFSSLVFRQAFLAAQFIFATYLLGGWLGGLVGRDWFYELFFIGLLNLLGAVALYGLELVERDNFLRRRLLREWASRDGMTGLYNRTAFLAHFDRILKQAGRDRRQLGLLLLDLDYFKPYNDQYGHLEGDATLRRVAQVLQNEFRRPLDLFARYGGEEFVGLWFDVEPGALERLAHGIVERVADLDIPHERSPHGRVTASVGAISFIPSGNESLLGLFKLADEALYTAKGSGRNIAVAKILNALPGVSVPGLT